jgi:deoxyadenosine/deoxycytidine kinase
VIPEANNFQDVTGFLKNGGQRGPQRGILREGTWASIPTLVQQIQKRGRNYENSIRLDYLQKLNQRYEAWASRYKLGKLLIINVDELNFAENKEDLSKVIDRIDAQLHGLF